MRIWNYNGYRIDIEKMDNDFLGKTTKIVYGIPKNNGLNEHFRIFTIVDKITLKEAREIAMKMIDCGF